MELAKALPPFPHRLGRGDGRIAPAEVLVQAFCFGVVNSGG